MKVYRRPDGTPRVWLEDSEIEETASDELRKAGLMPTASSPRARLEDFVERHLHADLDEYADLSPEVLGMTEFYSGGSPRVLLNKDLTGSALDADDAHPSTVGRWRATLAHEAAHVIFHRHLFEIDAAQGVLLTVESTKNSGQRLLRCLKRDVGFRIGGSDWREVQANKGMAALLMPRGLFVELARSAAVARAISFPVDSSSPAAESLIAVMAEEFSVSRQASRIRLGTCGLLAEAGQLPGMDSP